jgi:hypothetical protein
MGSSSPNREQLFDPIRQKWVPATPEEKVRQHWIQYMQGSLGFPRELFVVEKSLKELPHLQGSSAPDRRLDLLIYQKGVPLLLIECKAHAISEKEKRQLIGYNYHVKAPFIALVNTIEVCFGYRDSEGYCFHPFLPPFEELKKWKENK